MRSGVLKRAQDWIDGAGWDRVAWTAIAAGALIRLIWILVIHPPQDYVFRDMEGYVHRATKLATGGDLTRYDAFFPPGTHMLLAAPLAIFDPVAAGLRGTAVLWWGLSSAVPLLAWRLARRLLTPSVAALTAVMAALYPPFILYGGFFSSEIPSMVFLLGALVGAYRALDGSGRQSVLYASVAGLLAGGALITRPQLLLNLVLLAIPFVLGRRAAWSKAAAFAAAGALVFAAGVIHNSLASNAVVNVTGAGGITFFQGQCDTHLVTSGTPETGGVLTSGNPVAFERHTGRDYTFPDHPAWDQSFYYDRGWRCVREDGLGHVGKLTGNLLDTTVRSAPWPLSDIAGTRFANESSNLIYSVLLPFIVIGTVLVLWRRRWGFPMPRDGMRDLLLQLLCFVPVTVLYSAESRHRIPYDAFGLALLAALGVGLVKLTGSRRPHSEREESPITA